MPTGTVKFFNENKGYGFIQPDEGGQDAFVHITAVERAGMRTLRENQRIAYDLEEDRRGKMAAANLRSAEEPTAESAPADSPAEATASDVQGAAAEYGRAALSGPIIRNSNLQFFLDRAEQARADGDAATLDNVRERCRRSEAAWSALADKARRTERLREEEQKRKAELPPQS